jgi:hypothetical protein
MGLSTALGQTALFYRGGPLDAQVRYGGSPAYANYVYGVYFSAAGVPLPLALGAANAYAAGFSHYPSHTQMDQTYTSTPASNVSQITQGYDDQQKGSLCGK